MSELVALCLDGDASPTLRIQTPEPAAPGAEPSSAAVYGWGVGWYPSSERGASVVKDPTSAGGGAVSSALGDWNRFRSTIFLCHLRGHSRPRKQQDAQPFVRSYGGRQWIFAHDGDLAPDWTERLPLRDDPAFEPLGRTDSEHAFCWLLARLHAQRARSLAEVPPDSLQAWMHQLNRGGQLNALLTDGEHVVAYRDEEGLGELHWTRRVPPHAEEELASEAIELSLSSPEDPNRTALVFSSRPLTGEGWHLLTPGELIAARRGAVLWDSEPEPHRSPVVHPLPERVGPQGPVESAPQIAGSAPLSTEKAAPPRARPSLQTFRVVHETHYQYSVPVERSSHRLLLRPVDDRWQKLLGHDLAVDPAGQGNEYEDVFGNEALAVRITNPFDALSIRSESLVRVSAMPSLEHRASQRRYAIPLAWMPWQRAMLSAYLMPPELPESQLEDLSEFAMGFVERNDYDLVGTLLDLNETLYKDFEYVSGSTTNETTAFQVFGSRRGVCQDFANLMICLARLLHVPARYRMGYIHTGADYANKIQSDASHAWVELYLPGVGWHGFDPTNGIQVGADHVRVACGRNYRDATPTSGTIYRGGGTETLTIAVRVEPADVPAAQTGGPAAV